MARPKGAKPPKRCLNLTVSDQTRAELQFISAHTGESISSLVSSWAAKEATRISKATGTQPTDPNQMNLEEFV